MGRLDGHFGNVVSRGILRKRRTGGSDELKSEFVARIEIAARHALDRGQRIVFQHLRAYAQTDQFTVGAEVRNRNQRALNQQSFRPLGHDGVVNAIFQIGKFKCPVAIQRFRFIRLAVQRQFPEFGVAEQGLNDTVITDTKPLLCQFDIFGIANKWRDCFKHTISLVSGHLIDGHFNLVAILQVVFDHIVAAQIDDQPSGWICGHGGRQEQPRRQRQNQNQSQDSS